MRSFTFQQNTITYKNDTVSKKEVWTEAIRYPDLFRIDFGEINNGNAVIYNGDSSFLFSKSKMVRSAKEENDLLYLLGGMYFYGKDSVLARLGRWNYDLTKTFFTTWQGRKTIVIGAAGAEEKLNQLWYDTKRRVLVRILKFNQGKKEDIQLSRHVRASGNSWTETEVKFYRNDQLLQTEEYFNLGFNPELKADLFAPEKFGDWHWLNK